jgi:tetratricopeptide (TPR) repeat protein
MEAARDAQAGLKSGEDPWYPEIAVRHAAARAALGDCAGLIAATEPHVVTARATGSPRALATILTDRANASRLCGEVADAARAAENAAGVAPRSSNLAVILGAAVALAAVRNASGQAVQASAIATDAAQRAERAGLRPIASAAWIEISAAAFARHEYERAQRAASRALDIARKTAARVDLARGNYSLGLSLRARGSAAEAGKRFEDAQRLVKDIAREAGTDRVLTRSDFRLIVDRRE